VSTIPCNRVCEDRSSRQRGVTGNNQDADAPAASPSSAGGAPSNGRMGEVSDIVEAVLYLDGAAFVTGEVLHVDGGRAAGHHMVQSA
jgi:NAD(P)-dependent dehydrogenase (short-subunit alcohol dehydrogenase family)